MEVILLIILIYIAYRTILIFIEGKRLGKDTLIAFTGGLGTGKTLLGVDTAVRRYKYSIIRYYFRKIFFFKKEDKPILISNIPILLKKGTKTRDAVYSYKLKAGHLLMINQVPNNAVIFIDEIGHIVDQYSHSNPLIMIYVKEFIRWYRHYTKGGSLIITDQSSDEVNVAVRRRLNVVHNLENFRKRLLGLAYMVDTTPLMQTDGVITQMKTNEDKEYFVRFFPFTRRYDTYAFSDNYTPLQKFPFDYEMHNTMKANYFIDFHKLYSDNKKVDFNNYDNLLLLYKSTEMEYSPAVLRAKANAKFLAGKSS